MLNAGLDHILPTAPIKNLKILLELLILYFVSQKDWYQKYQKWEINLVLLEQSLLKLFGNSVKLIQRSKCIVP